MTIDTTTCRKYAAGMARFFRFAPNKNRGFLPSRDKATNAPATDTLTRAQQLRVRQLVRSLQQPPRSTTKVKATIKPAVRHAIPSGGRSYSAAELGRLIATTIPKQTIRRA